MPCFFFLFGRLQLVRCPQRVQSRTARRCALIEARLFDLGSVDFHVWVAHIHKRGWPRSGLCEGHLERRLATSRTFWSQICCTAHRYASVAACFFNMRGCLLAFSRSFQDFFFLRSWNYLSASYELEHRGCFSRSQIRLSERNQKSGLKFLLAVIHRIESKRRRSRKFSSRVLAPLLFGW